MLKTKDRIQLIDVLRGFSLLGIIIVHFTEQYYAGAAPESHPNFTVKFLGDEIISGIVGIFIIGKFYMIFSFLFGLSFFIQSNKSEGTTFFVRFIWRLILLFVIGFIHHLHYRGDILTIYAMLGVGLLLCYKLPDKLLLIIALVLTINLPSAVIRGIQAIKPPAESASLFATDNAANEAYYSAVKSGSYLDMMKANLGEFDTKYQFQVESGRIYITMGLFLLGLYAGRKKIFEQAVELLPEFKKYLKKSAWALLGVFVFALAFFGGTQAAGIKLPDIVMWAIGGFLYDVFNFLMAVIYVTSVVLLFQKETWNKRLLNFYEVGRMGLTTYLMQSVFGVLLFFSIGFGLLGEFGALASLAIGIAFFVAQIYFSKWWLARYRFGPFEWLWRSGTYLKLQPFKKSEQ